MSGQLQQFVVLAVAIVTLGGPAVDAQQAGHEMAVLLNELSDYLNNVSDQLNQELNELANRCRNFAGEQAAADLMNIQTTLTSCVNMEQLVAEIIPGLLASDFRKVFQVTCGKKDQLLTCANEGLQDLKGCLRPEEKKRVEIIYQILEANENFLCNNIDDIASIAWEDERECITYLEEKAQHCEIQENGANNGGLQLGDLEKYLASNEEMCKKLEETLHCMTDGGDTCKDPSILRLLISYRNEVLDAISCSNSGRGGAASLLALGTAPTSVVVPLAMCLAAPRVLHLQ